MLRQQMSEPLLRLQARANMTAEGALITYYTRNPFYLDSLERSMDDLERAILDMRGTLQAIRSRNGDPMENPAWAPVDVPIDDVPF
jgi:hypothetical protein